MDSVCNCFTNNAGNFVISGAFGSTAGTTFGSSGILIINSCLLWENIKCLSRELTALIFNAGFGTGGSLFGAKTTATTGFGTVTSSQTGTNLFGTTATGSTGLFGGANAQKTSTFSTVFLFFVLCVSQLAIHLFATLVMLIFKYVCSIMLHVNL